MSRSSTDDMHLPSILNMEHLYEGGLKTEYGLYAVSHIVEGGGTMYASEALEILKHLSKHNLAQLNKDNRTEQANEEQIIGVMFDVANQIIKRDPRLTRACYTVMSEAEKNNKDIFFDDLPPTCASHRQEFWKNSLAYIQREENIYNR